MRLRPLITFLFGNRPQESRDRHGVLLSEIEIGHPRARAKFMRIFNPPHHPAWIDLGTDLSQARSDLGDIFVALNQVTSRTADLLEQDLSLGQKRNPLELLHVEMARSAARLNLSAAQQRVLPVMYLTVGLLYAANRHTLAVMTRRTAKFIGWVGIVGKQDLAARMGFEGVLLLLKTRSIDRHMASLTAIHAGDRLIETIAVELL